MRKKPESSRKNKNIRIPIGYPKFESERENFKNIDNIKLQRLIFDKKYELEDYNNDIKDLRNRKVNYIMNYDYINKDMTKSEFDDMIKNIDDKIIEKLNKRDNADKELSDYEKELGYRQMHSNYGIKIFKGD
jgi:hypothetical protein